MIPYQKLVTALSFFFVIFCKNLIESGDGLTLEVVKSSSAWASFKNQLNVIELVTLSTKSNFNAINSKFVNLYSNEAIAVLQSYVTNGLPDATELTS